MIIKKQVLAAVLPATTFHDTRYHLRGVNVLPDGTAVATDGHVLLMAKDNSPIPDAEFPQIQGAPFHGTPERNVILDADVIKRLLAVMPKKSTIPVLQAVQVSKNGSDQTFTVAATDLQTPIVSNVDMSDGKNFPDHVRVLPAADKPGVVPVILGVPVLEALIKAAKAIEAKGIRFEIPTGKADRFASRIPATETEPERTELHEVSGAVRVSIRTHETEVIGAAMPMRV